ncbi:MAG: putative toxin-antitoxin system toxin component, PIN family [Coriobacteriales bacterium]|jgi:putative PIN family toxin of toxin-antitoxin system|nr:putative toxin-antitoxin system toxin component, PIN family [Coriobacteriales bacterium]
MRKLVLDTNVVVSALLKPGSNCDLIFQLIFNSEYELVICPEIAKEYEEVLSRPKFDAIANRTKAAFLEYLRFSKTRSVAPLPTAETFNRDQSDKVFYDLAVAAGAILITGNSRHFPKSEIVLTPTQFLERHTKPQ